MAAENGAHREGDGQVEHDHEPGGDGAIVDARPILDRDGKLARDDAVGRDDHVADGVPDTAVIGDGVEFAGDGVEVGVTAIRAGEGAVERVVALAIQGVGQFDGEAAGLHEGEGAAGDRDDVGVDGVVAAAAGPRRRVAAQRGGGQVGEDPAIAVPDRCAALQRDAMDHAVAEEPVMRRRVGPDRVGPHLQVAPVQARRDAAGDPQVGEAEFLAHRRMDADEEGTFALRPPPAVEAGDQLDAALGKAAETHARLPCCRRVLHLSRACQGLDRSRAGSIG